MSEHYFTERPSSELVIEEVRVLARGHAFVFRTASGVFSFGRVDAGSLLLAGSAIVKPHDAVLDLGCGWGLVGIVIREAFPSAAVTLTDVNERAVMLAKQNAKRNKASAHVLQGSLYEPVKGTQFDAILVNPPMKAGRELCYTIIGQAPEHLKPGGTLQLVALHNRGGKMLEKKMKEVFGNVETVAKKGGFRVYICERTEGRKTSVSAQ